MVDYTNKSVLSLGSSAVRRRILSLLLDDPDRRLHLREIQRRVGASVGTTRRELLRLVEAGVLHRQTEGRQVYFLARTDTPIYAPLRALVRATFGAPEVLRRHLQGLAGVERALIFGSYASSSDAPDSDIDVLIVGSPDRDDLTDRLESAGREVGRPVNEVVFSEHELRSRRGRGDRFIQSMEQGPVVPLLP